MTIERRIFLMAAGASAASAAFTARAQSFPTKPITLYSPWAVGGTTDQVMRAFAESASKILGQSVVVEARPGAGGILGAAAVAQARPDGYTLTQIPISVFRLPHTHCSKARLGRRKPPAADDCGRSDRSEGTPWRPLFVFLVKSACR